MHLTPVERDRARILIVDDDAAVADALATFLRSEGYDADVRPSGEEALRALADAEAPGPDGEPPRPFSLVLCDGSMPGLSGVETLRRIVKERPDTVVVMLTGYGTIEQAVEAVRLGAVDYLTKPVVDSELRIALERALRQQALLAENHALRRRLGARGGLDDIVGADPRMLKTYDLIEAVAPSKTTVLICGESGTGKSLIARAVHARSPRRDKPFVELACGSIPETLLESELFGHVKGAFTGAATDKKGRFLAADGGTIFLDEINSASPAMQLKLLRVLQERQFEPVGSNHTVSVDVRVVLASNQSLEGLVAAGQFRQDLYYRINVVRIDLPPLRDRIADVPLLAERFLAKKAKEHGRTVAGFSADAMEALRAYRYPGNVRELENIVERAVALARRPTIALEDLPPNVTNGAAAGANSVTGGGFGAGEAGPFGFSGSHDDASVDSPGAPWTPTPLDRALQEPEKRIILKALRANGWNRQTTAEQLSINRTTLYKKMKALGIDRMAG